MRRTLAIAAGIALSAGVVAAAQAETLTVCLEENTPPFSWKDTKGQGGFDLALSKVVAERLGRTLAVQWYEVPETPDNDKPAPSRGKNALLSAGKCQLVAGFPLSEPMLRKEVDTSRFVDFEGETKADRGRMVKLDEMAPAKPYHFLPFSVLMAPKNAGKQVKDLDDLAGLVIGSQDGTLADAILMMHSHRRLMRQTMHFTPGKELEQGGGLLDRVERNDVDATLVELNKFDAYKMEHPETKIATTGYYFSIGFNVAFVGLKKDQALLDQVSKVIDDMLAKNELQPIGEREHLTWLAPREPEIRGSVSLGDLLGNQ